MAGKWVSWWPSSEGKYLSVLPTCLLFCYWEEKEENNGKTCCIKKERLDKVALHPLILELDFSQDKLFFLSHFLLLTVSS